VASFCAKCGAEIPTNQQSCGACGAPVATAAAAYTPVQTTPYQPAATQPVPLQPVAQPAKSGSSAVKIILIVLAVFIGLGILGAGIVGYGVWKVAHAIRVSGSGDNAHMTFNAPGGGSISANTGETFSASDLGTDIYPGAQPGKGSMRMSLPTGSMVSAAFVTSDSKDQVVTYYKSKLGSEASTFDSANSAIITVNKGKQESVMITISVSPSQYDGKTQIHIVHSINNKPS